MSTWWSLCMLYWTIITSLIMISRLYLGVHGIHDLCGGLVFGGLWFWIANISFTLLQIPPSILESDPFAKVFSTSTSTPSLLSSTSSSSSASSSSYSASMISNANMTIIEYLDTIFMVHPYGSLFMILFYFSLALIHPLPTKFTPNWEIHLKGYALVA